MNVIDVLLRNRYVSSAAGIAITYILFSILQANHFIGTVLRGDQYYSYYLMFTPTLYAFFCLYVIQSHSFEKIGRSLVFGVVSGYVAGLAAYVVVVFSMGGGFARITNGGRNIENFLVMLLAPLFYLSWIYGALSALSVYLMRKRLGNR